MKNIIIVLVCLFVVAAAVWYGVRVAEAPDRAQIEQRFTDASGRTIDVAFDTKADTATLNGLGHTDLLFTRATSASGARYENTEEGLVLWNKGDDITLLSGEETLFSGSARLSPVANSLESTAWIWQHTELLSGEVVEAPDGDRFVLTFEGDGSFGSTTDCNSLGGSYVMDDEVLSFGQMVMTKMYCEGSMEGVYAEHLGLVNSYVIENNTLKLNLNRDYGVMVFTKK